MINNHRRKEESLSSVNDVTHKAVCLVIPMQTRPTVGTSLSYHNIPLSCFLNLVAAFFPCPKGQHRYCATSEILNNISSFLLHSLSFS